MKYLSIHYEEFKDLNMGEFQVFCNILSACKDLDYCYAKRRIISENSGLTLRYVKKVINSLKEKGIINIDGKKIQVLNKEKFIHSKKDNEKKTEIDKKPSEGIKIQDPIKDKNNNEEKNEEKHNETIKSTLKEELEHVNLENITFMMPPESDECFEEFPDTDESSCEDILNLLDEEDIDIEDEVNKIEYKGIK